MRIKIVAAPCVASAMFAGVYFKSQQFAGVYFDTRPSLQRVEQKTQPPLQVHEISAHSEKRAEEKTQLPTSEVPKTILWKSTTTSPQLSVAQFGQSTTASSQLPATHSRESTTPSPQVRASFQLAQTHLNDATASSCNAAKVYDGTPLVEATIPHVLPARFAMNYAKNIKKRAHCEWWTLASKAGLPALPQCGPTEPKSEGLDNAKRYRYTGPGAGTTPRDIEDALGPRHVIILGDSVSQQMWAAFVCYMTGNWSSFAGAWRDARAEQINKVIARYKYAHIGHDFADTPFSSHYWGEVNTSQGGTFEYYGTTGMDRGNMDRLLEYLVTLPVDLIIFQFGVWYQNTPQLRDQLVTIMNLCKKWNAACAFRETAPQHFLGPTATGLYEEATTVNTTKMIKNLECGGYIWRAYDAGAEWRNDAIWLAAAKAKYNISGLVWKVFDVTMPRGDAHHYKDCL